MLPPWAREGFTVTPRASSQGEGKHAITGFRFNLSPWALMVSSSSDAMVVTALTSCCNAEAVRAFTRRSEGLQYYCPSCKQTVSADRNRWMQGRGETLEAWLESFLVPDLDPLTACLLCQELADRMRDARRSMKPGLTFSQAQEAARTLSLPLTLA